MVSHVSAAGIVNFFPAINGNKPVIHTTVQHAHTYTKVIYIYIFKEKSSSHCIISERPKDLLNTSTWSPGRGSLSSVFLLPNLMVAANETYPSLSFG